MKKIWLLLLSGFLMAGCATGEKISSIREGMPRQEVLNILGNPDGFQRSGDYEAFKYTNRLISGWSWDTADYFVILKDGTVTQYGSGDVRTKDYKSNVLFLFPMR